MRLSSFALLAALLAFGTALRAQDPPEPDRRLGLALTGGITGIPAAVAAQCGGDDGGAGLEESATLVFRPWRWMIVQADVSAAERPVSSDCITLLRSVDTSYAGGTRDLFTRSTLRVGAETPPAWPLLRATVGIGRIWGSPTLPVTVFGLAAGSRGRRVRFLAEAEWLQSRVDATEWHNIPGPQTSRPFVVHPWWQSVRFGVEIPIVD